jgi:CYTH domain-containing protein
MGKEIEKKYLIDHEKWQKAMKPQGEFYRQGYLLAERGKTIRVRLTEKSGYLTIKGKMTGITTPEFEYPIPILDAKELLDTLCTSEIIKIRYKINYHNKIWEIDEFLGDNKGLIIAEIELKSEDEKYELPDFILQEVTGDKRYYNAQLSVNPFNTWK